MQQSVPTPVRTALSGCSAVGKHRSERLLPDFDGGCASRKKDAFAEGQPGDDDIAVDAHGKGWRLGRSS